MITLLNRQRAISIDTAWLTAVAKELLSLIGYSDFDLGILLTTNKTIQRYNETYRHKKEPTDILSFSYHPELKPGKQIEILTQDDKNLGDLILSLEYIKKDAKKRATTFEHRLIILLIHGICHLLGYDHETDNQWQEMQDLEDQLLQKLPESLMR